MKNFILLVNKDSGLTSRDVLNKLQYLTGEKKLGHTGTLDPMAKGILVCLGGKYTKLASILTSLDKEYIASFKLGIKTDTLDMEGKILEEKSNQEIKKEDILKVFASLEGKFIQTTPIYSARHVNGKRLYEYARNNIDVELPKDEVIIKSLELISIDKDEITFKALVSKGTYIRSLIAEITERLNVLGSMSSLIRTKQGEFLIEESYTLEDIKKGNFKYLSIEDVLDLTSVNINLDNPLYKLIINGNKLEENYKGYVLFKEKNRELALYEFKDNIGHLILKIC